MSNERTEIYCSFWLGETEFAVEISYVQEVLKYPENTIRPILAPAFLRGFVNLRGQVLPIVDLGPTLNISSDKADSTKALAIVRYHGILVALIVDKNGSIIRPKSYTKTISTPHLTEPSSFVKSVLNIESSSSLVQVLDLEKILLLGGSSLEKRSSHPQKTELQKAHAKLKKFITFTLNNQRLAFPISKVHEVMLPVDIQESAFQSKLCLGFLRLRGHVIPIVNLSRILNFPQGPTAKTGAERILIFKNETTEIGLYVDAVDSIRSCSLEEIISLDTFGANDSHFLLGCISFPSFGDTIVLDSEPLFENTEIVELVDAHKNIYRAKDQKQAIQMSKKQSYISFNAHHLFGVKLSEVEGIIDNLEKTTKAAKVDTYVEGIIKFREDLITLICPRKFYGLPSSSENKNGSIALVLKKGNKKFGLVADSVESILSLDLTASFKLPAFFHDKLVENLKPDISDIISLHSHTKPGETLMLLDVASLAEKIRLAS
jgi:purine-binding chemotaxis protein CheW